jgi:hypothetical protein
VTQVRTNLAGHARLHKAVFDRRCGDEVDLWWHQQHGILFVVPANENKAATADDQTQAAVGEGVTVGRREHTTHQGQGNTAWTDGWQRRSW